MAPIDEPSDEAKAKQGKQTPAPKPVPKPVTPPPRGMRWGKSLKAGGFGWVLEPDPEQQVLPRRKRMAGWHIDAMIELAAYVADPKKLPRKRGDKDKLADAIRKALDAKKVDYDDGDVRTLLARFYKHVGR